MQNTGFIKINGSFKKLLAGKITILLVVFCTITIHTIAMEKDTAYRIMSTKECLNYIENAGISIHDDDANFSLKSQSGVIYTLPNGEVVLMPTNFGLNYPAIIFKNTEVFKSYLAQDFFPIGEEKMTWLERNYNQMKSFESKDDFFSKILTEKLHVKFPFENMDDVKVAFLKVKAIADSQTHEDQNKDVDENIHSFGLALIKYLKNYRNYHLVMKKEYENYNPYLYPMMIKNDKRIDVLSKVFIHIEGQSLHSFENFVNAMDLR